LGNWETIKMIIDIFKTSIYKTSLENKEYIDYFYNIIDEQKKLNNSNYISNVGGFQTKSFNTINNKNLNFVFIFVLLFNSCLFF
jgi:hypothetical protein